MSGSTATDLLLVSWALTPAGVIRSMSSRYIGDLTDTLFIMEGRRFTCTLYYFYSL
ncbi:hypothetical protein ACFL6T_05535 [Candidatus Zixiibacteriota bacterium]